MKSVDKSISMEDFKYLADRYNPEGEFDSHLYVTSNAKRGLRNADGTGIVAGLTRISNVHGYLIDEYERVPVDGNLYYREAEDTPQERALQLIRSKELYAQ